MEVQIYKANLEKKIGDYSTTNEFADLTMLITEWRNHLGIKDVMTDIDLQLCIAHIRELYPEFSTSMIRMAIKCSLKGELKVDIKPYNSFSPMYISTILNAYKSYNDRIVSDQIRAQRRKEIDEANKPKEKTKEEKIQNRLEYLNHYKEFCVNKPISDFKSIMWSFLSKNNLFTGTGIVPDKELVKKAIARKKEQFIDLAPDDEAKLEQWTMMKKFFELNPNFDFTKHDLLID